ncbi:MAG TPA: methyltransferase domain-containing protein [Thermoanaerobaculia bacterium]
MPIMEQQQNVGAGVYAGRIARTINSGFISLMISIGHRTGLFDALAVLPPSTSHDIASTAGLAERHVREWLAAMVAAHIVDYEPRTGTYFLPIEYAAVLSRSAGADSMAPAAQLVSLLGSMEDLVVTAFRSGGGVTPEAYDHVNELMAVEKWQGFDDTAVEAMLEMLPGMRDRLVKGAVVLDVGCGNGAMLIAMARMFPRSAFRGYDLSGEAIARACDRVEESGLRNIEFAVGDGASIEEPHSYDLVFALESIHEHGFPRVALRHIAAALKRDGLFVMQEVAITSQLARAVDHPFAPMLYTISAMHSVPVALAQDGEAFGRMWGEERAMQLLVEAGFRSVRIERTDPGTYYAIASEAARS